MIPRIIHRTLPAEPSALMDECWETVRQLTKGWDQRTYQSPRKPEDWPDTAPFWKYCEDNAMQADLVRLEALWHHGGIYLDADVELLRPLDDLLDGPPFAAWEDDRQLCNAVMGAPPKHPAIAHALRILEREVKLGRPPVGPRALTSAWHSRPDVRLLPRESFYPYGYWEKWRAGEDFSKVEGCYGVHHWAATWFKP